MICTDGCCHGDWDRVGEAICNGWSAEVVRDRLEERDNVPYKVVTWTNESDVTCRRYVRDLTSMEGWRRVLLRQAQRFAEGGNPYLK